MLMAPPPTTASAPVILVLGDSLSSAYGMDLQEGWVDLLRARLRAQGYPHEVVNASIAGDTTSSALARLNSALGRYRPALVIVELGGNDGLRTVPVKTVRENLAAVIEGVLAQGSAAVLAGMRLPPNYGPAYVKAFEALYPALAQEYAVALVPFLLEGVAAVPGMMQIDGVHPSAEAQGTILNNVWAHLEPLLRPH